jgi:c-di-GMP-binding flagellar brake protein YcgR
MENFNSMLEDLESVLRIKQAIEIVFGHPEFLEEYKSVVERIEAETISITMPTESRVPEKTPCWVYTLYKGKQYGFETTVLDCGPDDQVCMVLKRPRGIIELQSKRKYFRVPVDVPVTFRLSRRSKDDRKGVFFGTIRNVSSGGLLVLSEAEIPLGSELLLFLTLTDEMDLHDFPARVVRGGVVEKKKKKALYEYGIEFYDIHRDMRRTIMQYVFNRHKDS